MSDHQVYQQWVPHDHAYGAGESYPPPMHETYASPPPLPPLWIMGPDKGGASYGPYQAPYPAAAPAPAHKVSPPTAGKMLMAAFGTADVPVRLSVKRRLQVSYIIIGIPLWFNIYHDYLLFTDHHVIFSRATMWSGIKQGNTFAIPYAEVDYLFLTKGSWRKLPRFGVARSNGGGEVEVPIDKKAAGFLAWFFTAPYS